MNFSIVITNYNYGRFLREALNSCLQQTYPAYEIIVVDDGSTDQSREILKTYESHPRVKIFLQENRGQEAAMQRGLDEASGDWILGLDADDHYFPDCLEQLAQHTEPGVSLIYFRAKSITQTGEFLGITPHPNVKLLTGDIRKQWMIEGKNHTFPPQSFNCFSSSLIRSLRVYPAKTPSGRFGYLIDRTLQVKATLHGKVKTIDRCLGSYRIHAANSTSSLKMDLPKFRTLLKVHELLRKEAAARIEQDTGGLLHSRFKIATLYWPYRMLSFKLDPAGHPFPGDSKFSLLCSMLRDDFESPNHPNLYRKASNAFKDVLILAAPSKLAWEIYLSSPRQKLFQWLSRLRTAITLLPFLWEDPLSILDLIRV